MDRVKLSSSSTKKNVTISVTGSKSQSNRALILNALSGHSSQIQNLSEANDTVLLQRILSSTSELVDAQDAGTAMRFLTAYYAISDGTIHLQGTARMNQRPIGILVEALNCLGADITYNQNDGYPPLTIHPFREQKENQITIDGSVSSQYISALLLIASQLKHGLTINLDGKISSKPYIQMTLEILEQFGVEWDWNENSIKIDNQPLTSAVIKIEPDWSGASYWYSQVALSDDLSISLPGFIEKSSQGDKIIATIMNRLGVHTEFTEHGIDLRKKSHVDRINLDFTNYPDLAQTISVICAAKGIIGHFTGLESLRIKETDRILALQNELGKIGAKLEEKTDGLYKLIPSNELPQSTVIETYDDHRMAMSFAPLAERIQLEIENPNVVKKSYPGFWSDISKTGIEVTLGS